LLVVAAVVKRVVDTDPASYVGVVVIFTVEERVKFSKLPLKLDELVYVAVWLADNRLPLVILPDVELTFNPLPVVSELALTTRVLAVVWLACRTMPSVVVLVWLRVVVVLPDELAPSFTRVAPSLKFEEAIWVPLTRRTPV
jgi:hypothetical protein